MRRARIHSLLGPAWVGLALLFAGAAAADRVVPTEQVRRSVVVRSQPVAGSPVMGALAKGESAELLESLGDWHRVLLDDGAEGFVSAAWTERRVPEDPLAPPAPQRAAAPAGEDFTLQARPRRRGLLDAFGRFLRGAFLAPFGWPQIDVEIREPQMGGSHRHPDPKLPVAGIASARGARGLYDIVLVIDASTSTNEFSEADVNGDGRREDAWAGADSIFQAQVLAARGFLETLGRMPGNRGGERIRLGVVSFAGDELYHRMPEAASFRPSDEAIYGLAQRDASLVSPLTSDYAALDRALAELGRTRPEGMTNIAAGIGRAMIELEGLIGHGAESVPRLDAEKVIHFLTDGEPRLPYDRELAGRAAVYAARMAGAEDIRLNVFAMGRNAVTRDVIDPIHRMAARADGRLVELDDPGDIVSILRTTSFSYVDRVKLVNRTQGVETDYIGLGIDGSFYGEIPLVAGRNTIEVVAVMADDRESSERFDVRFEPVPADVGMLERLSELRRENEALIEQIRQQLAQDIRTKREHRRQQKEVDLRPEN